MSGPQWYWLAIAVGALLMVFASARSGPLENLQSFHVPRFTPTLEGVSP